MEDAVIARFWGKVRASDSGSCWEWGGGTDRYGYGRFKAKGREYGAHRFAALVSLPDFAADLVVRHSCDNALCCNPAHLSMGTQADNIRDREARGRGNNEAKRAHVRRLAEFRRGMPQALLSEAWKAR